MHSDKTIKVLPLISNLLCRHHKEEHFISWAQMQPSPNSHIWTTTSWVPIITETKAMATRQPMASSEASTDRVWMLKELEFHWQADKIRKPWVPKETCIKGFKTESFIFQIMPIKIIFQWIKGSSVLIERRRWIAPATKWINRYPCNSEEDSKPLSRGRKKGIIRTLSTRLP